ncbi:glycoside hydrolase [Solirubrobacter phytolaccae]|uniref:Glycoside hydrolase n=1 Tax=Solirubrobacter phytolaccae TaxID=1404360 RepID=A0A9X3N7M3_9ACTN|nr:sialidase family protein [Solirubrobacter phytolaccae]MDA0179955.1 glycoside hydrolase [Solirubrobacter phytolaccae]
MRIGPLALIAFVLIAAATVPSESRAAPFVSDVHVVDGFGTVTASTGRSELRQWITRDGGRTFERLRVRGELDVYGTVLANGLGYARVGSGRLWRTVDGGRTWRRTGVRGVFKVAATSTSAWALRSKGRRVWLTRSDDGGRSWTTRSLRVGGFESPAVDIDFADAADGVISGLRPKDKPFLLVTHNGGRTWTERRSPCGTFNSKAAPDVRWLVSGTLWLVCTGPGGAGAEAVEVHTSIDAGRSFALRSSAPLPGTGRSVGQLAVRGHYKGFSPVSDRRAFMSSGYGFSVTRDGGRRWRGLRSLPVQLDGGGSVLQVDGKVRYLALGVQGLWRSPDAGARWHRVKL